MGNQTSYLSKEEEQQVVKAIQLAELQTSGEIRVHIEARFGKDLMTRAKTVFEKLGMAKTEARNGVLIYLAWEDHQFAILGDSGIDQKVPEGFWKSTAQEMSNHFKAGDMAQGLSAGIAEAGKQLALHFPFNKGDVNELSNEISKG